MDFLYSFLVNVIGWFYSLTMNYPLAIVLFTLAFKLILFPLDYKSRTSMRKTSRIQPLLNEINKKYATDPEKKNQKTMELYKKEKVNPMGGCLPVLIQWPVLIAVFGALRIIADEQIVTMFQVFQQTGAYEPVSFLWIHNIWQPDNFLDPIIPTVQHIQSVNASSASTLLTKELVETFKASYEVVMKPLLESAAYQGLANGWGILPIVAGGVQMLQTRLMQANQPQQAPAGPGGSNPGQMMKMMNYIFPLMFVFFCWSSNSLFSIYWITTSCIAIAEQYLINMYMDRKDKEKAELVKSDDQQ